MFEPANYVIQCDKTGIKLTARMEKYYKTEINELSSS